MGLIQTHLIYIFKTTIMKKLLFIIILSLPFFMLGQTTEDVQYYKSREVKGKTNFVDNKRQGEVIGYYESGEVKIKAFFVDGKKQGEVIFYSVNGEIERIENYKDGVLINNKN
jgi:antitoxin component YwqK of YwqJK toxin-antitoxin module